MSVVRSGLAATIAAALVWIAVVPTAEQYAAEAGAQAAALASGAPVLSASHPRWP